MILEIKVPSPGESITEVEISNWLISDGDYVKTTIPEGWSIEQISDNLYNNNLIDITNNTIAGIVF